MKKTIILAILLVLSSSTAMGGEYPYIYKGLRPMGMGGAFVAVSDDANALFYNPAGLTRVQNIRASLFPLGIEIGKKHTRSSLMHTTLISTTNPRPPNI